MFSDLVIKCGDRAWNVHTQIICPRSDFFCKAVTSGFKETESRVVELKEEDPALVDRMIRYFYYLDYEESTPSDHVQYLTKFHCCIFMYALGDRLGIDGLKCLSRTKLRLALHAQSRSWTGWDGEYGTLIAAISAIYNSTPDNDRGLRDVVINLTMCRQYFYITFTQSKEFESAVEVVPRFLLDLVRRTSAYHDSDHLLPWWAPAVKNDVMTMAGTGV